MAVSPPFVIAETLPGDSDLISIFPSQEHPFRDTVESWLTFLSDPTTGQLKPTAFAFPFVVTNTAAGTFFELESTDAGAAEGPSLSLYRNSASPAAADLIGVLRWNGQDSAGNKQEYGHLRIDIADPVSTSEDGTFHLVVAVAGTLTERMTVNAAGVNTNGTLAHTGNLTVSGTSTLTGAITASSTLGVTGAITGSSTITAASNIISSSGGFAAGGGNFAHNTSGTLLFRPNGIGSATAQMTYSTAGALTTAGGITATGNVIASGGVVFATAGTFEGGSTGAILQSGNGTPNTIFLRPTANSSTGQFTVATNGNANSSGDLTASSDRRLKKSIAPLNGAWAWDMVREIEPKSFIRKKNDTRSVGFIAQDVQPYAPELVHEGPNKMLTLAYPNMVAILWRVVQDLQKKIEELSK